ncbi:SpoIIIAH-like family protein [Kineothrix sp. MSJ-39]|uniref:SpoIIIAH-like family protein n=1 Tax=Kineothrix sp. MSJ-39 TaxID=2841533 RepID=UPI002ED4F26D
MKKLWKRNQIMITALALMIAIAGYLNFMGKKVDEENLFTTSAQFEEASGVATEDGTDMAAVTDITDESLALLPDQENGAIDESAAMTDIDSMDSEDEMVYSDYLDENQAENVSAAADDAALDETATAGTDENTASGEVAQVTEDYTGETPGEAVFTSSQAISSIAGANLMKEQTRAKNKEALLNIINAENLPESAKQDAVNSMIELTDITQKECAAEILLEAKGFADVVVSISGDIADVIVQANDLTEAQRAQIEDIVSRKTGIAAENIIISPVAEQ